MENTERKNPNEHNKYLGIPIEKAYTYMEVSHDTGTLLEKGGRMAALVLLFLILLVLGRYRLM